MLVSSWTEGNSADMYQICTRLCLNATMDLCVVKHGCSIAAFICFYKNNWLVVCWVNWHVQHSAIEMWHSDHVMAGEFCALDDHRGNRLHHSAIDSLSLSLSTTMNRLSVFSARQWHGKRRQPCTPSVMFRLPSAVQYNTTCCKIYRSCYLR